MNVLKIILCITYMLTLNFDPVEMDSAFVEADLGLVPAEADSSVVNRGLGEKR